ncbi:hypothetical protein DER44DRAFT_104793 [Fusarium oxysporum]|nr:hypothetical protein DER44DRAFT_104793 [Fusarium oxysporum]
MTGNRHRGPRKLERAHVPNILVFRPRSKSPRKTKRRTCTGRKKWYWVLLPVVIGTVGKCHCQDWYLRNQRFPAGDAGRRPMRRQGRPKGSVRVNGLSGNNAHQPPCDGPDSPAGQFRGCQLLEVARSGPGNATVDAVFCHDLALAVSCLRLGPMEVPWCFNAVDSDEICIR